MTGFYDGGHENYLAALVQQYAKAIDELESQLRDCAVDEKQVLREKLKTLKAERSNKMKDANRLLF